MWLFFDSIEVELENVSSIFALQYIKLDYCKCKAFLLYNQKDTIILYYYSMILSPDGGVVYIIKQLAGCQERHISSIHKLLVKSTFPRHPTSNITSTPTSSKSTKIKHFTTFYHTKNYQNHLQKSHQTLENKDFHRTQPKIPYLIKK